MKIALLALPLVAAAPPQNAPSRSTTETAPATLRLHLFNVRNDEGDIHICMTQRVEAFMDCEDDPHAVTRRVKATRDEGIVDLKGLRPGQWTVLVLHDENGDGKMRTSMGIPREGFGFSRNPAIRMGPPRADEVRFTLPPGPSVQQVKMKYIL
ncbi:DUF2141 domain-containing protein [Sphingomicrobium sp. XHP0239]|uniref:DUF2141 domain-containing protein n=1 Tax=Sphingomicrobium maritimum TaxID=3133972 RepID=UPI0031CC65C7